MANLVDPKFLKEQQYKNADNLEARIRLHRDYSVPADDWHRWVFSRLELTGGERLLEIGCGPASLWRENLDRLPASLSATLGDLSWGMAQQARRNMNAARGFRFLALDAQAIPFPTAQFDLAIANHMLYHVPDLPKAVRELRRVLKPGGQLFAATNGLAHMQKLFDLVYEFEPRARLRQPEAFQKNFCLENAAAMLGQAFSQVEVVPFESRLEVTEVAPLRDYILSMSSFWEVIDRTPATVSRLEQFLADKMTAEAKIIIPKVAGLAVAS